MNPLTEALWIVVALVVIAAVVITVLFVFTAYRSARSHADRTWMPPKPGGEERA